MADVAVRPHQASPARGSTPTSRASGTSSPARRFPERCPRAATHRSARHSACSRSSSAGPRSPSRARSTGGPGSTGSCRRRRTRSSPASATGRCGAPRSTRSSPTRTGSAGTPCRCPPPAPIRRRPVHDRGNLLRLRRRLQPDRQRLPGPERPSSGRIHPPYRCCRPFQRLHQRHNCPTRPHLFRDVHGILPVPEHRSGRSAEGGLSYAPTVLFRPRRHRRRGDRHWHQHVRGCPAG